MQETLLCAFEKPSLLFFSSNVPPLVHYSHFPALIISALIAIFIIAKGPKKLVNQILFVTFIPFLVWVFFNLIVWATNRSDIIMFLWSIQILIEPLIFFGMFYLVYVLLSRRDAPFKYKLASVIAYIPLIVITPTAYNLSGFDLTYCIPTESTYAYYTYVLETAALIGIALYSLNKYFRVQDNKRKKEILFISTGSILFLLAFASGNVIGSLTDDWNLAQVGLFGMPIFAIFFAYTVVKYNTFNVKLVSTNALMIGLWLLILSLFFVNDLTVVYVIRTFTLMVAVIFGLFLIRSVNREVKQREQIEILAHDLEKANEHLENLNKQKSEFVSFATHQLRSPLTAMKGYASLMLEGDFGTIPAPATEPLKRIFDSSNTLAHVVDDYLNVSRIELGSMKYNMEKLDVRELIEDIIGEIKPNIDKAGLEFSFEYDTNGTYIVNADPDKLKQVFANLIDNSSKYTPSGWMKVVLSKTPDKKSIHFCVKDSGVGISKKTITSLFQKFTRAENANKVNIRGTGLGLYVAKDIVTAHKGTIWAESEGEGKGSQFHVEIPAL